jgi:hypothetical protein
MLRGGVEGKERKGREGKGICFSLFIQAYAYACSYNLQ